jgi:diguanylate cyclase (GGDEF)-like protein
MPAWCVFRMHAEIKIRPHWWIAASAALVLGQVVLALALKPGFLATAQEDVSMLVLILFAIGVMSCNALRSKGQIRVFWAFLASSGFLWAISVWAWLYYEVLIRKAMPDDSSGDPALFIHIVPLMAAVVLRPDQPQGRRKLYLQTLNLLLLLLWWVFLYAYVVAPYQYLSRDSNIYGLRYDTLYFLENLVFLVTLGILVVRAQGPWKRIYLNLFVASCLYAFGSQSANTAIDMGLYHSGSLYDVPMVAAACWFIWVGFKGAGLDAGRESSTEDRRSTVGLAPQLAMLAVLSVPLMGVWEVFWPNSDSQIHTSRLVISLLTGFALAACVFLKQYLQDRELLSLLSVTQRNLDKMHGLQGDLVHKEKLLREHSTELARKNFELQEASLTDPLTRVRNRRYLEETLAADVGQVLRDYQRSEGSRLQPVDHRDLIFFMVDVDFFKRVNDEHGHVAGDELLRKFAERLGRVMRKSDVLVRWGGEEFVVVSRSADRSGASAFCSRILEVTAAEPFDLGHGIRVRKTCSIGWAPYPWSKSDVDWLCAEEVIDLADRAMYLAKTWGRNQSVGILPPDEAAVGGTKMMVESLLEGERGEVNLVKTMNPLPTVKDCEATKASTLLPAGSPPDLPAEAPVKLR